MVQSDYQGLVKGAILCFRNLNFYFCHGERNSTASQKSKDLNKVLLLLQDLGPPASCRVKKLDSIKKNVNYMKKSIQKMLLLRIQIPELRKLSIS